MDEAQCTATPEQCQPRGQFSTALSDGASATVADDFTPAEDGNITSVCLWGAYRDAEGNDCLHNEDDAFEVRYYANVNGLPSSLLAGPFLQSDATLSVTGPTLTDELINDIHREYAITMTHEAVPVLAGGCYWLEALNRRNNGCHWHWEIAEYAPLSYSIVDGDDGGSTDGYSFDELKSGNMAYCLDGSLGNATSCRPIPEHD